MKQPIVLMDEQQLIKQAVEALIEKLGVVETMCVFILEVSR